MSTTPNLYIGSQIATRAPLFMQRAQMAVGLEKLIPLTELAITEAVWVEFAKFALAGQPGWIAKVQYFLDSNPQLGPEIAWERWQTDTSVISDDEIVAAVQAINASAWNEIAAKARAGR